MKKIEGQQPLYNQTFVNNSPQKQDIKEESLVSEISPETKEATASAQTSYGKAFVAIEQGKRIDPIVEELKKLTQDEINQKLKNLGTTDEWIEIFEEFHTDPKHQGSFSLEKYAEFIELKKAFGGINDSDADSFLRDLINGGLETNLALAKKGMTPEDTYNLSEVLKGFKNLSEQQTQELLALDKDAILHLKDTLSDPEKFSQLAKENGEKYKQYISIAEGKAFLDNIIALEKGGIDLETVHLISRNVKDFKAFSGKRLEALLSLSKEELDDLINLIKGTHDCIIAVPDIQDKFDTFNLILKGKIKDQGLFERIRAIASKSGVKIGIDNDIVSDEFKGEGAVKQMSNSVLDAIDEALMTLKKKKVALPQTLYLSDMVSKAADGSKAGGGFNSKNKGVILINAENSKPNFIKHAIAHELTHREDYSFGQEAYTSVKKANALCIDPFNFKDIKVTTASGATITGKDIESLISSYAAENSKEFCAEVGGLLKMGVIEVKKGLFGLRTKYNINLAKSPSVEKYFKGWEGTAANKEMLEYIVNLFRFLMKN